MSKSLQNISKTIIKVHRHPVARAPQLQVSKLCERQSTCSRFPSAVNCPFFTRMVKNKDVFPSSKCLGPIRGPLTNHLNGPLALSLGLPQSVPMSFHHPLNIHQSWASKVQYIMYHTASPPLLLCKAWEAGPNRGSDLLVI